MNTYLLTWSPKRTPRTWEKEARKTAAGGVYREGSSTGRRKDIQPGNRLFLLKQGGEPNGIMGSGTAASTVEQDDHWDAARREAGDKALYIQVGFDRVLDPESEALLPLSVLRRGALANVNWSTQSSGISLDSVAQELERLWRSHLLKLDYADPNDEEFSALEGEQRLALLRHRKREGLLRKKKIQQVLKRKSCLECEVPGCGFDFFQVYGEIGRNFAHVHHRLQLSDRDGPSQTRLSDLAIVCPNCHAMIHQGGENRPLEGLVKRNPDISSQ